MNRPQLIDVAKLPAPEMVEPLDHEVIFEEARRQLIALSPDLAEVLYLESEPIVKLLQVFAYRELVIRNKVNQGGKAVMLAYATGADLGNLGALLGVSRLDEEPDTAFRSRIQLSLEGFSTAGPARSYEFWARSASPEVLDIGVSSPVPGQVLITVLGTLGDGTPSADTLGQVNAAVNADEIRPLCDNVIVQAATIQTYDVDATLELETGPDTALVVDAAKRAVQEVVQASHRLGFVVSRSSLLAALHQPGVKRAYLARPATDIEPDHLTAVYCDTIEIVEVSA